MPTHLNRLNRGKPGIFRRIRCLVSAGKRPTTASWLISGLGTFLILFSVSSRAAEYTENTSAASVEATWQKNALTACRRSSTTEDPGGGVLRLIEMEVIQDEIGDTVHPKYPGSKEYLKGDVVARKDFVIEEPYAKSAELCVFCNERLKVTINGHDVSGYERPYINTKGYNGVFDEDAFDKDHKMHHLNGKPFREYWQGGWQRIPVDPDFLREGENTVLLRAAKPDRACVLMIERSLHPNRSAVSRDGGKTWDFDRLSKAGNLNGEYVARLMVEHYPEEGWVQSESLDLWRVKHSPVAIPSLIEEVDIDVVAETPWGTEATVMGRLGTTPAYKPSTWTAWEAGKDLARGKVEGEQISETEYRYIQWKVLLKPSGNRKRTPVLKMVTVKAQRQPLAGVRPYDFQRAEVNQPGIVRPSHPFTHARNSKRLQMLKKDCKLEEVVEGNKRGLPQLLALMSWIKESDLGNREGSIGIDSSWDGLEIWHTARGKDNLAHRMCTHRAALFVQAATALGYPARISIWSHAVAEVWPGADHAGWVLMDPSSGHYVQVDGRPVSHFEAAMTWEGTSEGKPEKKFQRVWGPDKMSGPKANRTIAWHTRFWVPMRNNYLESPEPAEQGHGSTNFKYDGYLRLRHPGKDPLHWFSFTSDRKGDFDFTMNTVNLHLAAESKKKLSVQVETTGPNVDYIEARFGTNGEWKEVDRRFEWPLETGQNAVTVRSVNTFGIPGHKAEAKIKI
jgi:hypothetical protein